MGRGIGGRTGGSRGGGLKGRRREGRKKGGVRWKRTSQSISQSTHTCIKYPNISSMSNLALWLVDDRSMVDGYGGVGGWVGGRWLDG